MNGKKDSLFRRTSSGRQLFTVLLLMAAVCVTMGILKPGSYFTAKNLRSMLFQFPEYGILTFGVMFCMIGGGIDLSLVGIMNLSGMTAAYILLALLPEGGSFGAGPTAAALALAVIAALCVGAVCGICNGLIIGFLKLPAMLVTLCSLWLYNGIVYGITGGPAVTGMHDSFKEIANGTFGSLRIPYVLPIFLVVFAAAAFLLHGTGFGREIYYMGASGKVSEYSGLHTVRITVLTYMTSGILGSISGVLMASHVNAVKSSGGSTYTLLSILIAVLGGVHPNGGRGNAFGVALSVVLMQMVSNAFTLLRISQDVKNFANGILLVVTCVAVIALRKSDDRKRLKQGITEKK